MLRVARLALVVASVPLVSGCFYLPGSFGMSGGGSADMESAQANVRSAIPAIEAYFADNGTYEGASLDVLRGTYDSGIGQVRIVRAEPETYCVESTSGSETYSKPGPASAIVAGGC